MQSGGDYAVAISGEIDMELDDGVMVKLKAGDALVQRGTIHNRVNRGKDDCVVTYIEATRRHGCAYS